MTKADVVVVGSCNIDFTCFTERIPKRGETIYGKKFMTGFGGKGGNQCIAATKLGSSTAMIGRVGSDHFGKEYLALLKKLNVDTSHISITEGVSSGVAQITVSESEGDNYILIVEGANGLVSPKDVENASDLICHAKVGLFQFEIPVKTTIAAMKLFKEISKAILILNPTPAKIDVDPTIFKILDVIVVNETEAEVFTEQEVKTVEDGFAALKILLNLGCETAIITLGGLGAVYATKKDNKPNYVKVDFIEYAVDPTGAGDLFVGALAYSFVYKTDSSLNDKIKFACFVARECVNKPGAQDSFPYKNDISHLMD